MIWYLVIWSETFDLKRFFRAIWSELSMRSEAKSAIWHFRGHFKSLENFASYPKFNSDSGFRFRWNEDFASDIGVRFRSLQIEIFVSDIFDLKRIIVRYEAICSCDLMQNTLSEGTFYLFEANYCAIWSDFFRPIWSEYEAIFSCDMKRNSLSEAKFSISSEYFKRRSIICPYMPLCSRHVALNIITLEHLYPELWIN